jgi:hypothetical protein
MCHIVLKITDISGCLNENYAGRRGVPALAGSLTPKEFRRNSRMVRK